MGSEMCIRDRVCLDGIESDGEDAATITCVEPLGEGKSVRVQINRELQTTLDADGIEIVSRTAKFIRAWVADPRYYSDRITILAQHTIPESKEEADEETA